MIFFIKISPPLSAVYLIYTVICKIIKSFCRQNFCAVHWDKTYKTNLGIDVRMLDSRLGVTLDAYYDMGRELFTTFTGTWSSSRIFSFRHISSIDLPFTLTS